MIPVGGSRKPPTMSAMLIKTLGLLLDTFCLLNDGVNKSNKSQTGKQSINSTELVAKGACI